MAYTLGGITLPNPKEFKRVQIETASMFTTLNGTLKKDITNRKERFILTFRNLSQTNVTIIVNLWNDQTTKTFQVNESNLTISATTVHIEIENRTYTKGPDYREDLDLILTEVS